MDAEVTPLASTSTRTAYLNDDFAQAGHTNMSVAEQKTDSAIIETIAARIPRLRDEEDPLKLTPLRAHYLKKTLVKLQVEMEMESLSNKGMSRILL